MLSALQADSLPSEPPATPNAHLTRASIFHISCTSVAGSVSFFIRFRSDFFFFFWHDCFVSDHVFVHQEAPNVWLSLVL